MIRNYVKDSLNFIFRKGTFWLLNSFLFALFSVLLIVIIIGLFKDYRNIPSKHLIGNRSWNVEALKERGFPFSFLVIGDTKGSETAETLIKMALRKESSSFMVILGDFVDRPDIWHHRFFLKEMTVGEIKPPFPVFLVPGNHDIDYSSKIKEKERRVTPEVYDSLYGARNFNFVFNKCLFIICAIDSRNPANYLSYLRETLSNNAVGRRHVFVFNHVPPKGLSEHIGGFPNEELFFSILEEYKVTTCFFGDYHGYWRGQRKGVNLIVSGGGGAHLKRSEWGEFHHILRITVDEDKVGEEIITMQGEIGLEDLIEEWIFVHIFPIIENRVWILYLSVILFLSWGVYSAVCFVNSLKKEVNRNLKSGHI